MIRLLFNIPFLIKHAYLIFRFESWNKSKIEKFQIKQFKKIFEKAIKLPFYKEIYKDIDLSTIHINSIADLQKLPIIHKELCRKLKYEDYFISNAISHTITTPTSGSTGKPFHIQIPARIEMIPALKVLYAMRQYGWNPTWKGLEIWREDNSTHKGFMRKLGLLQSISIFKPLDEIKECIEQKQPDFLFCNRSFYMILADYFERIGFSYTPKFLLCTAEEVRPEHRQRLETFFNAKLLNIYGCMESPTLAYTCPECNNMHIFESTAIVEVVNKRDIDGETFGDIVLTNLTNNIMPFVRYKTGDVVKVIDSTCACGRKSQIIGDIIGRSDDVIQFSHGHVINYLHLYQSFRGVKELNQYKVVFYKNSEKLEFIFSLKKDYNKNLVINNLHSIILNNFENLEYSLTIVDEIAISKSGKFKIVEVLD